MTGNSPFNSRERDLKIGKGEQFDFLQKRETAKDTKTKRDRKRDRARDRERHRVRQRERERDAISVVAASDW